MLEAPHEDRGVESRGDEATEGWPRRPSNVQVRPLVISTILRHEGITGVHTHFRQLRCYLEELERTATVVTPFSWSRVLAATVFAPRLALARFSGSADVAWYRHWHGVFLQKALTSHLAEVGDCVVYAQCPVSARAALRARRSPQQRVVMAVHFSTSQADEWVVKNLIKRDGAVFRAIRQLERDVIPRLDGLVYVSQWAKQNLLSWLPEAAAVPSAVIDNFVSSLPTASNHETIGDLVTVGNLLPAKNHRYLLDVLAAAKRSGRSLTLDIFGEGSLRKDLERRAYSLGLEGQVRFRGFRTDVREFLPHYRAYVHASYSESSSLAIIEAMAAGLPIVAGDIGPIAELCDDGVEARFWPLDDHNKAAGTLLNLLESEPARLKAASASADRFRRDFASDVLGPRLWSFLMEGASTAP